MMVFCEKLKNYRRWISASLLVDYGLYVFYKCLRVRMRKVLLLARNQEIFSICQVWEKGPSGRLLTIAGCNDWEAWGQILYSRLFSCRKVNRGIRLLRGVKIFEFCYMNIRLVWKDNFSEFWRWHLKRDRKDSFASEAGNISVTNYILGSHGVGLFPNSHSIKPVMFYSIS